MKVFRRFSIGMARARWHLALTCGLISMQAGAAQPVISEILFNPPGPDLPHEYIELRGAPNQLLGKDIYLVVAEGDTNGNPGLIQNVFDLSDLRFGGNGFLVLLQKNSLYTANPASRIFINEGDDEGFGSGSGSSIHHRGESNQIDLENGSATYFLVHSSKKPDPEDDMDANDDGVPDGDLFAAWDILDSIGILDNDGFGDIAYGAINFRRNASAYAQGTIVDLRFTPDYLARLDHSTGSAPGDWLAGGNLEGIIPNLEVGDETDTEPPALAGALLNHLGGPNFGAPAMPGVVLSPNDQVLNLPESSGTAPYTLALNTVPSGPVTFLLQGDAQIEISIDGGSTFTNTAQIILDSINPVSVLVRAIPDLIVEPNPRRSAVSHQIIATEDPLAYSVGLEIPLMEIDVADDDTALLSEVKINPPGSEDSPYEYFELRGRPGLGFEQVYIVTLEGDAGADPGVVNVVIDLTGATLGGNGLLLVAASNHPYSPEPATMVLTAPVLDTPGGGLANGSTSVLLLASEQPLLPGEDLDKGDNGILEGLPSRAFLLDAVGWTDGSSQDLVFGGVDLTQPKGTPDAAARFPDNLTPLSAPAWFAGNLLGTNGGALVFDPRRSSTNFPGGTPLTPGALNRLAPYISPLPPFSGVIADPTNPVLEFLVDDPVVGPAGLILTAHSSNPEVVPDQNLVIQTGNGGQRFLSLQPVGVGYTDITLEAFNGELTGLAIFTYGASAAGDPDSRFHTLTTDASTAIAIPPDLMLVGDDENQNLRLYRRYFSGPSVSQFNMEPFLGLTDFEDGKPREVDIEASDRVGDRIYWVGSHSHADVGEIRTNRAKIFATDIVENGTNTTVTYVGRYDHLKRDLINWDANNLHGKGAHYFGLEDSARDGVLPKEPRGAGFNIEGFVMAPGSTSTGWICFRAPIVPATNRLYALIVPVTNFDSLSVGDGPPGSATFGEPIELDLQGRGIRSIDGDTNGLLIISGPAGNIPTPFPPHDFKIYTWTGHPADRPVQWSTDLTGLNPEAIVENPPQPWNSASQFQLLSDNGRTDYYDDGTQGKLLPHPNLKKFRSDIVTFGPAIRPQPFFTSVLVSNGLVSLTWRSNPGDRYRLQYKEVLSDEVWTDLPGDITATGPLASRQDMPLLQGQRFYQIMLLP